MKKLSFVLSTEDSGLWSVWLKDESGYPAEKRFVEREMPLNEAVQIIEREANSFCCVCGARLRKSEGDGPCSDCMTEQCQEKDKEEAPAPA